MTSQNDQYTQLDPNYRMDMGATTPAPTPEALAQAIADIADLKSRSFPINFNTDMQGLFETVSAAPTLVPKSPYDQVKIYVNGATLRLYWYDGVANVWHYVTATA